MTLSELPPPEEKTAFVRAMFDTIAKRYDFVNRLISFGLDRSWRLRAIQSLGVQKGAQVADVGCGTGDLTHVAAKQGLRCFGLDLSYQMLRSARVGISPRIQADASAMPIRSNSLDGVVTGFALRNFTDQDAVFAEVARVLRPGGRLVILEMDRPDNPVLRLGHKFWFNAVVPRIGAIFSDPAAYRYLPKSVAYLPTPNELAEALACHGLSNVSRRQLHGGLAQIVCAQKETPEQP